MTTIVKHKRTGNEYILLGINGDTDKTNPSRFISELFAQEKSEVSYSATVCDVQGNLFLAYIDDLVVTAIDGKKPADILPAPDFNNVMNDFPHRQTDDFDDEELTEEFSSDKGEKPIVTPPPAGDSYISPPQDLNLKNEEEDDDDWI